MNIADPTTVYTLINSAYGTYGDTVGSVEFQATGGLDYTVNLVEGGDIRDHNNDGFNNTIGQGKLGGVYVGSVYYGGGQVRLDEQGFLLPTSFNSATLTAIILHGTGEYPAGEPFLAAATVATPVGQDQVDITKYVNANLRTYSNGTDYPIGGTLVSTGGGPIVVKGGLTIDGQGGLSVSTNSNFWVAGNLLGNTTDAAGFNPLGNVILNNTTATSSSPQLLEAMSQDMGRTTAGLKQNFAYNTLTLESGDYVELVDQSNNSPGNGAEAVYANLLVVPAGTTLNLNGLNLWPYVGNDAADLRHDHRRVGHRDLRGRDAHDRYPRARQALHRRRAGRLDVFRPRGRYGHGHPRSRQRDGRRPGRARSRVGLRLLPRSDR